MNELTPLPQTEQALPLIGEQTLVIEKTENENRLRILAPTGEVTLAIRITPSGPVLVLDGAALEIQARGSVSLAADRIRLAARESLELHCDGELKQTALQQEITATRGDVRVKANDDVRLNGERVRVNC